MSLLVRCFGSISRFEWFVQSCLKIWLLLWINSWNFHMLTANLMSSPPCSHAPHSIPINKNAAILKEFFRTAAFLLIEFLNILHWKPEKKSNWVWSWDKIWVKLYVQYCEKSNETGNIIRFSSYFTWGILFKAKR